MGRHASSNACIRLLRLFLPTRAPRSSILKSLNHLFAASLLSLSICSSAVAQGAATTVPQNVIQLSASGTVDVQQDLLVLTLAAAKEGEDAATVQTQLRQALDAGLTEVRKDAAAQQMDVRTGTFSISPRYGDKQRITGWEGRAELVLEGRDFPRITGAAARVSTLTVSSVAFGLSRDKRESVERDAQKLAIEQFKTQATQLSTDFGFSAYGLREVSVDRSTQSQGPMLRMMAMKSRTSSDISEPIAVEAGKAAVTVTVSGSIQMR